MAWTPLRFVRVRRPHGPHTSGTSSVSSSRGGGRPTSAALVLGGVTGTLLVGNLLSGLSPMYIGALMDDLPLSEADAGLVMSVEPIAAAGANQQHQNALLSFWTARADFERALGEE